MRTLPALLKKTYIRAAASLAVIMAIFSFSVAPAAAYAIKPPASAFFYGDSVLYESRILISQAMAKKKGWTHSIRSYPGFAVCDWQSTLASDIATYHPTVVVLETMGNYFTNCMKDANGQAPAFGSQAWLDKYQADLNAFFNVATTGGSKVVFLRPPPMGNTTNNASLNKLITIAIAEAGKFHGVSVSAGPRNSVSASGKYVPTMKCLATETPAMGCDVSTGKITVRSPDGVHLCPLAVGTYDFLTGCPVYSSGAFRYARAVVATTVAPPAPILP